MGPASRKVIYKMNNRPFTGLIAALFALLTFIFTTAGHAETIADPREGWERLWKDLIIDISAIGIVFSIIAICFLIRYKRKHPDESGSGVKLKPLSALGWAVIPVFVFLADDIFLAAKNFELWNLYRKTPENAYEVSVEAGQWSWDFIYSEGIRTTNELRVPAGRPVVLRLTSRDVIHSLFIPDFRVKWDAMPGKNTHLWFYPKKTGEHVLTCTEYCGMLHYGMYGKVIILQENEFLRWIQKKREEEKS